MSNQLGIPILQNSNKQVLEETDSSTDSSISPETTGVTRFNKNEAPDKGKFNEWLSGIISGRGSFNLIKGKEVHRAAFGVAYG